MKRGKPLKRSGGLKRSNALGQDVEKVREFMQRGRGQLERSAFAKAKGGGMRRSSAAEGPLTPEAWREAVWRAAEGKCCMSGDRALGPDNPRFDAHHVLAKRHLRSRGLLGYVWDERNGIWLSSTAHEMHEHPGVKDLRVPAEKLPESVWRFCDELDALVGTHWATELVLRAHPRRAHPGTQ